MPQSITRNPDRRFWCSLIAVMSKGCDWVERRAGPAGQRDRSRGQQKVPALSLVSRFRDGLKIAVVKDVHSQRHQDELVNWMGDTGNPRREHIAGHITSQQRYIALLQPPRARRMESGGVLRNIPGAQRRAPRPSPSADKHRVARRQLQPGLLLPRFEVFGIYRRPRLKIRHSFQRGHIHQDSAGEDPLFQRGDRELPRASLSHLLLRVAVVHLALPEHMAECVEMRVLIAVERYLEVVDAEWNGTVVDAGQHHRMLVWIGVVFSLLRVCVTSERNRETVPDQRRRLFTFRGGDQVDRPELVVLAPSSPVGKLGHHSIDVSFGQTMLLLKHYARELACGQCERNNSSKRQPCSCLHERQSPFARFGSAEILLQKV